MWMLAASALAVSPGGFRVGPALPVRSVEVREAFAVDDQWVSQTTLAVRSNIGNRLSFTAETPFVLSGGTSTDAAFGVLRLGGFAHLGRTRSVVFTLGMEGAFQYVPDRWTAESWATIRRSTVPAGEVLAVGAIAFAPGSPWTIRVAAGFRTGPFESPYRYSNTFFTGEVAVANVQPITGRTSAVLEAELMVDTILASARVLARFDLQPLTLDVGGQIGIADNGKVAGGPLVAARRFF